MVSRLLPECTYTVCWHPSNCLQEKSPTIDVPLRAERCATLVVERLEGLLQLGLVFLYVVSGRAERERETNHSLDVAQLGGSEREQNATLTNGPSTFDLRCASFTHDVRTCASLTLKHTGLTLAMQFWCSMLASRSSFCRARLSSCVIFAAAALPLGIFAPVFAFGAIAAPASRMRKI